jgi:AcrR family transcriptional regulator
LTAIEIIDEIGIQKLTTREIAKRQQISEATIFRHFKNKNELLVAVLDYFIRFDAEIIQTTKLQNLNPTEALIFLISSYAAYYESYPAVASILLIYHVLLDETELSEKIKDIQSRRTSDIKRLVDEAVQVGELSKDVDSDIVAVMIYGSFKEICLNWKISNYNFTLRERSLSALEILLSAFHNKALVNAMNIRRM